jgi:hypothetical protein
MKSRLGRVLPVMFAGASLIVTGLAFAQPAKPETLSQVNFGNIPNEQNKAAQDAERAVNRVLVSEAMRQIEIAEGQPVSSFFPLPSSVSTEVLSIALGSRAGWKTSTPPGPGAELEDDFLVWTMQAGHLAYYEWACRTGRDSAITAEVISELHRLFTDYPQRLLMQDFDRNRRGMGYGLPAARRCLLSDLERGRRSYRDSAEFLARL